MTIIPTGTRLNLHGHAWAKIIGRETRDGEEVYEVRTAGGHLLTLTDAYIARLAAGGAPKRRALLTRRK